MKYIVKGLFNTGDEWSETANNKDELKFIIDKINNNQCVSCYNIYTKDGKLVQK